MPFCFLKYLQPTHYFRLKRRNGDYIYPKVDQISCEYLAFLDRDERFQTKLATEYDLSWQAICKGYIGDTACYQQFKKSSVQDNYLFIRKYFNSFWVLYVLLLRILSFHNPIVEFRAWYKTRKVERYNFAYNHLKYNAYSSLDSSLVESGPMISVVIPTLNRYTFLENILKDLEKQIYKKFEVIIVDQSDDIKASFYRKFNLDIHLIKQKEKALWLARNTAIQKAKGSFIALSEDDVRISDNWLLEHLKCIDYFNCEVSAGVFHPENQSIPKERSFFSVASQLATGNALMKKSVFEKVGLFDRQFEKQRMGDGEFGLRLYLKNIKCVSNPIAKCVDIKAHTGGLRELGSWDSFRPTNFFAPRPIPSVVYFFRSYFGSVATRFQLLRSVPLSLFSYKLKRNRIALFVAGIMSILISPIIFLQVYKSWRLASEKINEGPLIPELKNEY